MFIIASLVFAVAFSLLPETDHKDEPWIEECGLRQQVEQSTSPKDWTHPKIPYEVKTRGDSASLDTPKSKSERSRSRRSRRSSSVSRGSRSSSRRRGRSDSFDEVALETPVRGRTGYVEDLPIGVGLASLDRKLSEKEMRGLGILNVDLPTKSGPTYLPTSPPPPYTALPTPPPTFRIRSNSMPSTPSTSTPSSPEMSPTQVKNNSLRSPLALPRCLLIDSLQEA